MQLEPIKQTRFHIEGFLADYLRGISNQWLKPAPDANPGMLEMFADRDRRPYRDLVAWAGEFSGKYLTGAVQVLRLTGDPELRQRLERFVKDLVSLQDKDGYLGPWPQGSHLTNKAVYPDGRVFWNWDSWGHYFNMLGLLLWHEETGDRRALNCAQRMGNLFCNLYFGDGKPRLAQEGNSEMNLAPAHSLCLLYRRTGERKYLDLARHIVEVEFSGMEKGQWPCGNYLEGALAGMEFFELPKPRWESLHPILALAELYDLTGEPRYREAFVRLWQSIADLDRHNNGGFSSGEQATGNPFDPNAIETCCTIAWMAMSVEMLRLTGDPQAADELELSLFNSVIGMHSPSGRWATYNTPMDGVRRASIQDIVFQAREGTPELNCCSVNSARGFGLLSDWALMRDSEGLVLNAYFPGTITAALPGRIGVTLTQTTHYPMDGRVFIMVTPERASEFTLKLRIPRWSRHTIVKLNGQNVQGAQPGRYWSLRRRWKRGDKVELSLDMGLHFWIGEQECRGKVSVYRGPLLLTYDRRFNAMDPDALPAIEVPGMKGRKIAWHGRLAPLLLMEFQAADGRKLRLCDFGSAGQGGSPYHSWLPLSDKARSPMEQESAVAQFPPSPRAEAERNADARPAATGQTAAIPQFFASPREALEAASLLRFALRLRTMPMKKRRMELGHLRPEDLTAQLDRIEREWPAFQQDIARARAFVAKASKTAHARRLASVLERLDREGLLEPSRLAEVTALKEEIRRRHLLMERLTHFEVSELLPAPADIRTVEAPPDGLVFRPGVLLESVGLCDVRPFHRGQHGMVYVRVKHTANSSRAGRLLYGADGPVKVWVNGIAVGCHPEATNPAVPGQFHADVTWRAGENGIVFALVTNAGRAWGVFASVSAAKE